MSTLEIIHLRLGGTPPEAMIKEVYASIAAQDPGTEVHIYRDAAVETDLAIHLRTPVGSGRESDLGLRLAAALREHGLVDHSVWLEEKGNGQ